MSTSAGAPSGTATPVVLIVGEGPPSRGGIPSFVAMLQEDPWLAAHARVEHLNTSAGTGKRPGAATLANLRNTLTHAWAIARRARAVDVVHLNLSPAPLLPLLRALALSVAARSGGAGVVLHAHTGRLAESAARRSYRAALRLTLRVVHVFVVVSREAEWAVRPLGSNVVRVENGVDTERIRPGTKAEPPEMLFVGTVCERKGLIDLRDALARIGLGGPGEDSLKVRIVGDGLQEGPEVFERVVAAYRAAGLDGVEFLGAVEPPRVAAILERASVFCLPSHREGLPLSLLEGMAGGAAVIATRVGDVPAVLEEGASGVLVEPGDVPALAAAIERLVTDPEERRRFGAAARARVEEAYDSSRLLRRMQAIYARAAGHRRRHTARWQVAPRRGRLRGGGWPRRRMRGRDG